MEELLGLANFLLDVGRTALLLFHLPPPLLWVIAAQIEPEIALLPGLHCPHAASGLLLPVHFIRDTDLKLKKNVSSGKCGTIRSALRGPNSI